jgi:hypothetical protein
MIVITIMGILAGLGFSAFNGTMNLSRAQRTGSIINKIDQLIGERWEGYRTRAVPVKVPVGVSSRIAAIIRLNAIRDLMRLELPDRKWDVIDPPCDWCPAYTDYRTGASIDPSPVSTTTQMISPSLRNSYVRRAWRATHPSASTFPAFSIMLSDLISVWTPDYQGSECLYLILSTMRDGDKSALDYFDSTEIGDTDGDGMPEILDGWGTPITFIRWPAGYAEQVGKDSAWGFMTVDDDGNGTVDDLWEAGWLGSDDNMPIPGTQIGPVPSLQTRNYFKAPDPFDPVKVQSTIFSAYTPGYALFPLIVSAGPNKSLDIVTDTPAGYHYSATTLTNNLFCNPYVLITVPLGIAQSPTAVAIGTPADVDSPGSPGIPDGQADYTDNISNHSLRSQES